MNVRKTMTAVGQEACKVCIPIKNAGLKVPLFCIHGAVERISNNVLQKTINGRARSLVAVKLLTGISPNGHDEFFMDANDKVNMLESEPRMKAIFR